MTAFVKMMAPIVERDFLHAITSAQHTLNQDRRPDASQRKTDDPTESAEEQVGVDRLHAPFGRWVSDIRAFTIG